MGNFDVKGKYHTDDDLDACRYLFNEHEVQVEILGKQYTINIVRDHPHFKDCDGFTDFTSKEIYIRYHKRGSIDEVSDMGIYESMVLRHEIIHAFLFESGLDCETSAADNWAKNEEMIDWFAIQAPKIFNVFKYLGIERR